MEHQLNTAPEYIREPEGSRPSAVTQLIIAVIAAAAAGLIPEFGIISAVLLAVGVLYTASSRGALALVLLPAVGVAAAVIRAGVIAGAFAAGIMLAAIVAGWCLRRGGDFCRALMLGTFVILAGAFAAAVWYMNSRGISVEELADHVRSLYRDAAVRAAELMKDRVGEEAALLFIGQAEATADTALLRSPAMLAVTVQIAGTVSLRLTGLLHDITGSTLYRGRKRRARVDRVFAAVYGISLVMGAAVPGAAGICSANLAISLMIPAGTAGLSVIRCLIERRKYSPKPGIPVSLIILSVCAALWYPSAAIVILTLVGAGEAFFPVRDRR